MTAPQILKKVEKLEAFAQMALNEATAIRKELEGSGVPASSARKGKAKKAALAVVSNRRKKISQ